MAIVVRDAQIRAVRDQQVTAVLELVLHRHVQCGQTVAILRVHIGASADQQLQGLVVAVLRGDMDRVVAILRVPSLDGALAVEVDLLLNLGQGLRPASAVDLLVRCPADLGVEGEHRLLIERRPLGLEALAHRHHYSRRASRAARAAAHRGLYALADAEQPAADPSTLTLCVGDPERAKRRARLFGTHKQPTRATRLSASTP
eukprot:COSAG06_NODE_270_length_18720_cov_149.982708_4_plen_202_part_00